jgi:cyclic-di-GMP-binding protein
VWQEIPAFPHEKISTARTTLGAIEISLKQLAFSTDGTSKPEQATKLHVYIVRTVFLYTCRMPDNSFDVVSVVDMPEVLNAAQQARKEVQTRFDLKDSKSEIELNEKDKKLVINSIDDFKLKAVVEILQQKLAKRKVPLKNFSYGPITPAAGSTVRQEVTIQSGIPVEKSREIVKKIKDSKIKVQVSIQGDLVRVSGKSRDLLQEVIQLLRSSDFGLELQFTNYRTF